MKTVEYNGKLLTGRFIHKRQALFFHKTTGKTFDIGLHKIDDIRYMDLEEEFASLLSMPTSSEILTKTSRNRKKIDVSKIKNEEVLKRLNNPRNKKQSETDKQTTLRTHDWNIKISTPSKYGTTFAKLDILNRNRIVESPFGGETEIRIYEVETYEPKQCPGKLMYRLKHVFDLNEINCIAKSKCWYKKPLQDGTIVSDRFDKKIGRKIAVNNLLKKFPELKDVVYTLYPELNY